jgi:DNA-binding CsgD family transcriptional regulator
MDLQRTQLEAEDPELVGPGGVLGQSLGPVELLLPGGLEACDATLRAWQALVEGRLVVRASAGPSGRLAAYRLHARAAGTACALSALEEEVLAQVALGRTNKEVAYALGLGDSQVSRLLGSAARKVGVATGREAVRLAALLLRAKAPTPTGRPLSPAEREVAALLVEGLSDEEIAARRGTATRTASNQVASILRKTGAPGRRAFLGHAAP